MGPRPIGVVQGMDLDDVGPKVGEGPSGEGSGYTQSEVEYPNPLERVSKRKDIPGNERLPPGRKELRCSLGQDRAGVGARERRRPVHLPRRRRKVEQHPHVSDPAHLRIVDFDHASIGEVGGIRKSLSR